MEEGVAGGLPPPDPNELSPAANSYRRAPRSEGHGAAAPPCPSAPAALARMLAAVARRSAASREAGGGEGGGDEAPGEASDAPQGRQGGRRCGHAPGEIRW